MGKLSRCSLCGLVGALLWLTVSAALASDDVPLITDTVEYEVFAAVLFPEKPEVPAGIVDPAERRKHLDGHRVRLDGVHSGRYELSGLTITGSQPNGADEALAEDFNLKNGRAGRIDREKLLAAAPKGAHLSLVPPPTISRSTAHGLDAGVTCLSRPGFNRDRTKAMLQINHLAGPEMGAGYLVYLEKSAASGKWSITGAVLNRRY